MPDNLLQEIKGIWAIIIAVVASVFGLGMFKKSIVTKPELYEKDGTTKYVPRTEIMDENNDPKFVKKIDCDDHILACPKEVCRKIDAVEDQLTKKINGVEEKVNGLDTTLTKFKEEQHKFNLDLSGTMGALKQFTEDYKNMTPKA